MYVEINSFIYQEHLILVTVTDLLKTASVSKTKHVNFELPNYPDLLYCDPVVLPGVPYSCSIVMLGNVGPVKVEFNNANVTYVEIAGQCKIFTMINS